MVASMTTFRYSLRTEITFAHNTSVPLPTPTNRSLRLLAISHDFSGFRPATQVPRHIGGSGVPLLPS